VRWAEVSEGGPVLCVAVDPIDAEVMYAGTWAGLYRSTDAGASWSLVDLPFADPVFSLSWDPQGSRLFAGGAGRIFVTERSGSEWAILQLPADGAPPVSAFVVHPDSPSLVFAGTRGRGAFRSDDGGVSWTAMELREEFARSDPRASEVTDMAFEPKSGNLFVATLGGLFRGRTTLTRADVYAILALVFRPQDSRLYAATASWISSWEPIPSIYGGTTPGSRDEKETGTEPSYISDLALDPHDPSVLWAGDRTGLYRGRFNVDQATGQQMIAWSKVSGVRGPISSIASSPVQAGLTVAGALTGFWMSTDNGTSWHRSSAGMRAHHFLNVVPVHASPATLFGLAYSFLFNEEQWVQVFRSTDSGETWTLSLETPILGRPYLRWLEAGPAGAQGFSELVNEDRSALPRRLVPSRTSWNLPVGRSR